MKLGLVPTFRNRFGALKSVAADPRAVSAPNVATVRGETERRGPGVSARWDENTTLSSCGVVFVETSADG